MADHRVAAIDVGTVSTRLLIGDVTGEGVTPVYRAAQITDLGQGRSVSSFLNDEAITRTVQAIKDYAAIIKETPGVEAVSCTLTSAARDAENIDDLLDQIKALGIHPQVIPGDIEARLTFLGVAQEFPNEKLTVVDVGGGSTEVVLGELYSDNNGSEIDLESVRSFDVGCRRVSELFLRHDPPLGGDLENAREWIAQEMDSHLFELDKMERLVAVGGTPTSLAAVEQKLDPYDPTKVHLYELTGGSVADLIDQLAALPEEERAKVPGLQAKRAPVIVAGGLILEMLLALSGFSALTVSESDSLVGLSAALAEKLENNPSPIDWRLEISRPEEITV